MRSSFLPCAQSSRLSSSRYRICITLEVPPPLYDRLPANVLRSGNGLIPVMPVFFTHGVNEMQTLANKLGETEVQEAIVTKGMRDLTDYCKAYSAFIERTADKTTAAELTATLSTLLGNLQAAVKADKSKNVYILTMSSDLARKMNGGRLTCCKSGKDRTGMSVTLEQARILIAKHAMEESKIQEALHLMRSMGTRMDNVEKNIGQRKCVGPRLIRLQCPRLSCSSGFPVECSTTSCLFAVLECAARPVPSFPTHPLPAPHAVCVGREPGGLENGSVM